MTRRPSPWPPSRERLRSELIILGGHPQSSIPVGHIHISPRLHRTMFNLQRDQETPASAFHTPTKPTPGLYIDLSETPG
ncbi:hypothetical protein PGT21_003753 [Puccinia graminis f. sp. tritici]|uniref:Uncharacterized protein n=1 Tax=Puccinia graminis f. sp. tritici TaxID=56615 RepID=A0A5B0P8M9_PUCGR|nr:hypothetical protein PGT21_003753 [Puccinia graminis f. sp. tritici]